MKIDTYKLKSCTDFNDKQKWPSLIVSNLQKLFMTMLNAPNWQPHTPFKCKYVPILDKSAVCLE